VSERAKIRSCFHLHQLLLLLLLLLLPPLQSIIAGGLASALPSALFSVRCWAYLPGGLPAGQ
jgi:hypothetical protein